VGDDPATGRDVAWMLLHPLVGGALALAYLVTGRPALLRAQGRWIALLLRPASARRLARRAARKAWLAEHAMGLAHCIGLFGLSVFALFLSVLSVVSILLSFGLGLLFLLPPTVEHLRWLPMMSRRLARDWAGVEIAEPYKPRPARPPRRPDGMYRVDNSLYKTEHWAYFMLRWKWLVEDRATWRDLLWMVLEPVGGAMVFLPIAMIAYGFWALLLAGTLALLGGHTYGPWYGAFAGVTWLAIPVGLAMTVLGFVIAPVVRQARAHW
jgi:hypothetical protein